jgi:transcriptional regulator with XRE-family HTH domain
MNNNYTEVIKRIFWATGLRNTTAIARKIGITPQALSNYKKRTLMPLGVVLQIANKYGMSMDWLLSGQGNPFIVNDPECRGNRDMIPELNSSACVEKSPDREALMRKIEDEEPWHL